MFFYSKYVINFLKTYIIFFRILKTILRWKLEFTSGGSLKSTSKPQNLNNLIPPLRKEARNAT